MFKLWVKAVVFCLFYTISTAFATEPVNVTIIPQYDAVNIAQNMGLLVKFEIAPGWHIFSQNPGEIGLPTSVEWSAPEGISISGESWSNDKEFVNEGFIQRGFANLAYLQTALIPHKIDVQNILIDAKIKWLACNEDCIPQSKKITLNIPVSKQEQLSTNLWNEEFAKAQKVFVSDNDINLPIILLMAFIGGIVINIMPCIFPILVIKVINLAQVTKNYMRTTKALAYCSGVVTSFMIIATLLWGIRSAGNVIGWGFQFQSSWFVGIMALLFMFIGLMLLDVVNITSPITKQFSSTSPILTSFVTGCLAVLIATPCTAPFMGVAIGYALSAPIYTFYPVFFVLSLGYALPFTLAELFPQQIKKILPKPGVWMVVIKKILAIPVFMTVAWLLWVLYNLQNPISDDKGIWQNYDAKTVENLVNKDEKVFINFTAKWCLTCVINKKTSLETDDFIQLAKKYKIHLFEADWTNNSDDISMALDKYNRSSVPLYVFYNGKSDTYEILPQILTPAIVEKAIKNSLK